jgi:Zn-dependent protease
LTALQGACYFEASIKPNSFSTGATTLPDIDPGYVIIFFVVFLFSLSFHEAAHAWTAERFGDSTARYLGRITLNPIPHIDIFGTIIFPLVGLISGGMMFGWAKPVPVNTNQMRDRKLGDICTSLAGPVSNAILVVIFFVLMKIIFFSPLISSSSLGQLRSPIGLLLEIGWKLNVILMVFNLFPIPPLDGSHVLRNFLSGGAADFYDRIIQPYGFLILIALLFSGVLGKIIYPILNFMEALMYY